MFFFMYLIKLCFICRAGAHITLFRRILGLNSVSEIKDTVFAKTSPKRSFSMTEYERFGLVFTKKRVYKFGHRTVATSALRASSHSLHVHISATTKIVRPIRLCHLNWNRHLISYCREGFSACTMHIAHILYYMRISFFTLYFIF